MGLFDSFSKILSIGGAAKEFADQKHLNKKIYKKLNQQAGPLEIPQAYQQLMAGLVAQADKLGGVAKNQINQDFQASLAKALANLRQRGLASGNLTANLTAGSQKKQ